ncbi:MAG: YqjF family protein [Fimbriimonadales bacterium]
MATDQRDGVPPISERAWKPALSMRWKHLLFVHWRVPPLALRPLIPEPLQIDTYDGAAWVGFVPFVMETARPIWLPPVPKVFDFPEANIRTYVRYGAQRGVWFFSLDAAHRLGVWAARRFWKLPYYYARMRWRFLAPDAIHYETIRADRSRAFARVQYRFTGEPRETEPGSLEHFLVERYTLFTAQQGELYYGEVAHLPYAIQPATVLELEQTLTDAAGIALPPQSPIAFYAPGFGVLASALRPLRISNATGHPG